MAPFRSQPGVVEVEPANHGANVECSLNGIELKAGAWNTRAVGNNCARHDRAEQLAACGILKRLESAPERVDQAIPRGPIRKIAVDLEIQCVVGDVSKDFVRSGAFIADVGGHVVSLFPSCVPQSAQIRDSPAQYRLPMGE